VIQECNRHKKHVDSDARKQIINAVEAQLWEVQREVRSELELSSYTNKSPIVVFDHLVSVVEKHLTVPQQKSVRDILMKMRNDELLRCLLNISIYLGTIDQPEKFIVELQKLNQKQAVESGRQNLPSASQSHVLNKSMDNNNPSMDLTRPTIETSFGNSSSSHTNTPQISLKQLCSDMFKILTRYDAVLTLKQLFDIKKHLCNQYSFRNFSEFGINDDDDDNIPLDMISFLNIYREKIDPNV
jgi:hypothetical protein